MGKIDEEIFVRIGNSLNSVFIEEVNQVESSETPLRFADVLNQLPDSKRLELDFYSMTLSENPLLDVLTFRPTNFGKIVLEVLKQNGYSPFPRMITPHHGNILTNLAFRKQPNGVIDEYFWDKVTSSIDKLRDYNPVAILCKMLPHIGYKKFFESLNEKGHWSNSMDFVGLNRNPQTGKKVQSVNIGMWIVPYCNTLIVNISTLQFVRLLNRICPDGEKGKIEMFDC